MKIKKKLARSNASVYEPAKNVKITRRFWLLQSPTATVIGIFHWSTAQINVMNSINLAVSVLKKTDSTTQRICY